MKKIRVAIAAAVLAASALPASAQVESSGWQAEMDLVTAGAAASILLHHVCAGSSASQQVVQWVAQRLNNEVARLSTQAPAEEVRAYVFDAADLKVKAMTQSTQGQSCSQLHRLRSLAISQGFPLP